MNISMNVTNIPNYLGNSYKASCKDVYSLSRQRFFLMYYTILNDCITSFYFNTHTFLNAWITYWTMYNIITFGLNQQLVLSVIGGQVIFPLSCRVWSVKLYGKGIGSG